MPIQDTGSAATTNYLKSNITTIDAQARALWDRSSGAPGLLDATPGTSGGTKYIYDFKTKTYIRSDNGLKVTDQQVRSYVNNVSQAASDEMRKNTQQLIAGIIMTAIWYARMRDLMAALYRSIWVLAFGGWLFEDDTARNLFYIFVMLQFAHLDNFYYQIEHEIQPLNGQAMARAGLYAKHGNGMFQNVLLDQAIYAGDKFEARRILGVTEEHCQDSEDRPGCIELAAEGWMPIEDMTPIGDATCYDNCLCRFEFR